MSIYELIGGIVLLIISIILVIVIMLQEGKQAGLSGSISGGNDSYSGRGRGKSNDALFATFTKVAAALFFLITLGVNLANVFLK